MSPHGRRRERPQRAERPFLHRRRARTARPDPRAGSRGGRPAIRIPPPCGAASGMPGIGRPRQHYVHRDGIGGSAPFGRHGLAPRSARDEQLPAGEVTPGTTAPARKVAAGRAGCLAHGDLLRHPGGQEHHVIGMSSAWPTIQVAMASAVAGKSSHGICGATARPPRHSAATSTGCGSRAETESVRTRARAR